MRLRNDYPALLRSAGYTDIETIDLTPAYLDTARAWYHERDARYDAFAELMGASEIDRVLTEGRAMIDAIEDGLLQRSMLLARRPTPASRTTSSAQV